MTINSRENPLDAGDGWDYERSLVADSFAGAETDLTGTLTFRSQADGTILFEGPGNRHGNPVWIVGTIDHDDDYVSWSAGSDDRGPKLRGASFLPGPVKRFIQGE